MTTRTSTLLAVFALALAAPAAARAGTETLELEVKAAKRLLKLEQKRERAQLSKARRFLKRHPEIARRYDPSAVEDPEVGPLVSFRLRSGGSAETRLDPLRSGLRDLGARLLDGREEENLRKLYRDIHARLPAKFLDGVLTPDELVPLSGKTLRKSASGLWRVVALSFDSIYELTHLTEPGEQVEDFIGACESEIGYEAGNEISDRCLVSEYASLGIMANVDFPLKYDITCIKDQGARGTCVAHGIAAALESQLLVNGGAAENLSEQYAYLNGEIHADFGDRFQDGLTTADVLDEFEALRIRVPHEEIWQYNRAAFRADYDPASASYPDSCFAYSGEECTDFAFQGEETISGFPPLLEWSYPTDPLAAGSLINGFTTIATTVDPGVQDPDPLLVILQVEASKPVLATFGVPPSFRSPDADGYVQDVAGELASGNHLVLLIGFVSNADLPLGAPPDPAGLGYFVMKNSWGTDYADCGFAYLSYGFVVSWHNSFWYLDDDVD